MARDRPISDQLRDIFDECGITRYEISKRTGIDQATLTRFYHKQGGVSVAAIDALGKCLGLTITMRRKPRKESE